MNFNKRKSVIDDVLKKTGLRDSDPVELLREWSRAVRREQRSMDRQLFKIEREEYKIIQSIKILGKKGEHEAIIPLAEAIVNSRRAKSRIHTWKANMNSLILEIRLQIGQVRMAKCIQGSTKVMKAMNTLLTAPSANDKFHKIAVEMQRAGLIQEVIGDALEPDESIGEAFGDEVDKVISEVTMGIFYEIPEPPTSSTHRSLAKMGKIMVQESFDPEKIEQHVLLDAEQS